MKTLHMPSLTIAIGILLGGLFVAANVNGQTKYQSTGAVKITVEGTSNIHDWTMESDKGVCTGLFDINNAGLPTGVQSINFSVPAESLKSEHKGMDKNSYKALNTGKYAAISFTAGAASVQPAGNAFTVNTHGKLTISGITKDVQLSAKGVVNPDKSITYTGSYQLNMTDFKVEPPSLMFGAIKTGDKVTVKFNLVLKAI